MHLSCLLLRSSPIQRTGTTGMPVVVENSIEFSRRVNKLRRYLADMIHSRDANNA